LALRRLTLCLVRFPHSFRFILISCLLFPQVFVRISQITSPPISSPSGHPPMLCTILSNPRASPTSSHQPIPTHHPGHVPLIHLAHRPLLPGIPCTQMAIYLITCSPSTTTRTPSHTTPLHLQMEVSPLTSLDKPSVLGRAHREVPRVRSSHPIGSSSYSNARCVVVSHRLVLRANPLSSSDDSCFSITSSSSSCQCYGIPHSNKVCDSHYQSQQASTRNCNKRI
jgi:hypothetical protein